MNHNPKKFFALLAAVFCLCSFSAFSKEKDPFKIRKNPFLLEFEYELDDGAKAFLENSGIKYKKKKIQMNGTQVRRLKFFVNIMRRKSRRISKTLRISTIRTTTAQGGIITRKPSGSPRTEKSA